MGLLQSSLLFWGITVAICFMSGLVSSTEDNFLPVDDESCGIWLAPSTIPGAGFGMFAGRNYSSGEQLSADLVIAITDMALHGQGVDFGPFLWDEYTWSAGSLKLHGEGVAEVNVASPGFGAAANCILALVNVEEYAPSPDDYAIHSRENPAAGAITAHHQRRSTARRDIASGSELLVSYGSEWFTSRPQLGPIPLYDEMERGSVFLRRLEVLESVVSNETLIKDLWDTFVLSTAHVDSRTLVGTLRNVSWETLHSIHRGQYKNNVTAVHLAETQRSLSWLKENGRCTDLIQPGLSPTTMGYGAFARIPIAKGTVVAPVPLIHIRDRASLDMYAMNRTSWNSVLPGEVVSQQLLLNYCFGHGESSLLLCPYGPAVNFVNHNQTLANVKLQWANPKRSNHHPHLLDLPVTELPESSAQLAMELVATSDLKAGEEVFLDYGDAFEAAWHSHVKAWSERNSDYSSAAQLNQKTTVYPTVFEEFRKSTKPKNVELQCDSAFRYFADDVAVHMAAGTLKSFLLETEADWWTCEILRRSPDDKYYAAFMYNGEKENFIMENITADAFHFVDRPYTSNTFLPNAFRHEIRIPDEIFPEAWRNRKAGSIMNRRQVLQAKDSAPSQCDTLRSAVDWFKSSHYLHSLLNNVLSWICPSLTCTS